MRLATRGSEEAALVRLSDWAGLVTGRTDTFNSLLALTVSQGPGTWGSPLRMTGNDRRDYFVKTLEGCPADAQLSLAAEQIVGRLGKLIGAPVCETSLIRIHEELAGSPPWLRGGLAHASLAVERADLRRPPLDNSRTKDDNRRRHAGVYALCDWCFSSDDQWLCDLDDDEATYSHDHGLYFPPVGSGYWTRDELVQNARNAHELGGSKAGLDRETIRTVADTLDAIDRTALVEVLRAVPASWPVSGEELEALGWFLEYRAPGVASRVRALV